MRIRHQQAAPNLCRCTVAVLLKGWTEGRPPVACTDDSHAGFFDLYDPGGVAQLWAHHESYLRVVAREWGWQPTARVVDGRELFYGEAANLFRERMSGHARN